MAKISRAYSKIGALRGCCDEHVRKAGISALGGGCILHFTCKLGHGGVHLQNTFAKL